MYNLSDPSRPYKQLMSPLKYQTRAVAAFPNKQGYLVGSIEGRWPEPRGRVAGVEKLHVQVPPRAGGHLRRERHKVPPRHGTFATCGRDGVFNFWDKDSKQRLKQMAKCNAPIPCGDFNRDGSSRLRLRGVLRLVQGRLGPHGELGPEQYLPARRRGRGGAAQAAHGEQGAR